MSNSLTTAFVAAIPLPALFIRVDERVVAINDKATKILGEGLNGRHYITALRQPSVLEAIESCAQTGESGSARYLGSDGSQDTTFELHCARIDPEHAGDGDAGILVTLTDVTSAEQNLQIRRDFVANVSHEMRTPLTAVIGFIETLQGPAKNDPTAQERFLGMMARETTRMTRLVGDLLSLTRVEAEARQRPKVQVTLADLLASCVHTMAQIADDAAAELNLTLLDPNVVVPGDADQLRQVITNLIENALKYGGPGVAITVTLEPARHEPRLRGQGVRISVSDTGPGLEAHHIPRLAERFYRVDSHRSREMGGTGLGLAIVKHILNRHRGRLEVQSKLGEGSVFTVVLPLD